MYPIFYPHDLLTCATASFHTLGRGDITVFRSEKSYYEQMTVHRVCEVKEGKPITRRDNTERPDEGPVTSNNLVEVEIKAKRGEKALPVRSYLSGYARHRLLLGKRHVFRSLNPAIVLLEKMSHFQRHLKNLILRTYPGRIVFIRMPGSINLPLFLHNILTGWMVYNGLSWYIRSIFQLFLDSQLLLKEVIDLYLLTPIQMEGNIPERPG